jgi:hypothetical protein
LEGKKVIAGEIEKYFTPKKYAIQASICICDQLVIKIRVARWFIFKPKIPIWVNFGGP